MRRSIAFALSSVSLGALAASPGYAQTEQTQIEAQQVNDQVQCSVITDPVERQECLDTQGANALPESGAPEPATIVVTGSRLARPNFETLQPTVVIDSAQLEARGFETLGQAINEQPSFGVPGSSPVGGQAGSFGSGQSFVNFLGLGSQRTLTLVNGRRFVSSNTASIFGPTAAGTQVDLNSINTKLVDRVETIAIGGAPIYGSDAIAGTINVILKRNFEGIDLDAQYGISSRGDAANYRLRALAGMNFADGRGNVTVSGEFNKGEGLLYNDRKVTRQGNFYGDCPPDSAFNQCLYADRRIPSISESGIPLVGGDILGLDFPLTADQSDALGLPGYLVPFGPFNGGVQLGGADYVQFSPSGQLIPIDFGTPVGGPGDFNIDFSGGNGFNLFNTQQLLTDTKRYNFNLLTQFELTDNIRLFAEGWYAFSKGTNLREQPVYNSALFDAAGTPDGNIILDINNPFLTADQRAAIQTSIENNPYSDQNYYRYLSAIGAFGPGDPLAGYTQDYFYLGRANTDIISGRASTQTDLYRIVGGLDGTFRLGEREYTWELVGNYGRAKTKGREPVLVQQNFENAVNAVLDGSGNIVCAPGYENAPIETLSSTCVPINLFGTGQNSQAALDYITTIANPSGTNKQYVATASVAGPVVSLPGGDLGFVLGYEHRQESTSFDPGEFFYGQDDPDPLVDSNDDGIPDNDRIQYGRSIPIFPVKGKYNTDEVFGEVKAEIISPRNDIPAIHSLELHGAARYVDHSTAGSDWTYTVEGRWGIISDIAVRANYTRAIRAPAITEVFNPSSTFFGFANDPCDADNLGAGPDPATRQANCLAAGVDPSHQSTSNQASFTQALAGNVDLDNEKSKAWAVGVVLSPRFAPGLTITADYVDIKLEDAISSFSATSVLNACYDSPDFPNEFCDLIQRDAGDDLTFVETRYFNAAQFKYQGVLGALDYRARTPFLGADSRIGVNLSYQYLRTLESKASENAAPSKLDGSIGYPKHSAVLNVNYQNGRIGLFSSFNYTGKVEVDPDVPNDFYEHRKRDSVVFVNSGVSFDINKRMTFRLVVDNVFDTKPPYPAPAGGGVVSYFPGVLGRYFRVGASAKF